MIQTLLLLTPGGEPIVQVGAQDKAFRMFIAGCVANGQVCGCDRYARTVYAIRKYDDFLLCILMAQKSDIVVSAASEFSAINKHIRDLLRTAPGKPEDPADGLLQRVVDDAALPQFLLVNEVHMLTRECYASLADCIAFDHTADLADMVRRVRDIEKFRKPLYAFYDCIVAMEHIITHYKHNFEGDSDTLHETVTLATGIYSGVFRVRESNLLTLFVAERLSGTEDLDTFRFNEFVEALDSFNMRNKYVDMGRRIIYSMKLPEDRLAATLTKE